MLGRFLIAGTFLAVGIVLLLIVKPEGLKVNDLLSEDEEEDEEEEMEG